MTENIAAILAKPSDFGFEFVTDAVVKKGHTYNGVPLIALRDIPKFEKAFPGLIIKSSNGTSIRVGSQRVVRDAAYDGVKDQNELRMRLVRWLLGIEQPQAIYPGPIAGQKFATEEDAKDAWETWALKQK